MRKVDLKFSEISDDLLASGNIYWRQKSGTDILISAKGDLLNFEMLEKLASSDKDLIIEDSIEFKINKQFLKIFQKYSATISIKEKILARKEFNLFLIKVFYHSRRSQFELDQLCWKLFSNFSKEEGLKFIDRDRDYFKRSRSVASSYVMCAFLIGYYDVDFLRKIYNTTMIKFMNVGKDQLMVELKESLEMLRVKGSLTPNDKNIITSLIDLNDFDQSFLFEKFDGSGIMTINIHEMNDLELILSSLNYFYHFNEQDHLNILAAIHDGNFPIDKRLLNLIKRNFELLITELVVAA